MKVVLQRVKSAYVEVDSIKISEIELELLAEELRSAVNSLGRITGNVDVEDLLEVIFSDFCIGK